MNKKIFLAILAILIIVTIGFIGATNTSLFQGRFSVETFEKPTENKVKNKDLIKEGTSTKSEVSTESRGSASTETETDRSVPFDLETDSSGSRGEVISPDPEISSCLGEWTPVVNAFNDSSLESDLSGLGEYIFKGCDFKLVTATETPRFIDSQLCDVTNVSVEGDNLVFSCQHHLAPGARIFTLRTPISGSGVEEVTYLETKPTYSDPLDLESGKVFVIYVK